MAPRMGDAERCEDEGRALTIADDKTRLRKLARERRSAAALATPEAAAELAARGDVIADAALVSFYWPMRDEMDPRPLATRLEARGAALCLPYVGPDGMGFRRAGDDLVAGTFGTMEPPPGPDLVPDLLLVPLLAFNRAGDRLGYGGGYYDRWLAAHPLQRAIGLAYAAQEMPDLPIEPHDAPLTGILTEREYIATGRRP